MADNQYYTYNTNSGVVVPDTADIKAEVEQEFKTALQKDDLDTSESTPQGRLIEAETVARKRTIENMAQLANMFNPDQAYGIFLDSLLKLFGVERKGATATKVICQLTGEANTIIPANVQAKDTSGNIYYLENSVTLNENGQAEGTFVCFIKGEIECNENTLNQIVTAISGWESINNGSAGIVGKNGESDKEARANLKITQYTGSGQLANIKNSILSVKDVEDSLVLENETNSSVTKEGILITKPHSIYICVDGGNKVDVAKAIIETKSAGCAYGADTDNTDEQYLETVQIENSTVVFARPTLIPVKVSVTLKQGQAIADTIAKVKQAIINYANNKYDEVDGLKIGTDVSPFEIASAITLELPDLYIAEIKVSTVEDDDLQPATIEINANQKATITEENITVGD